MNKNLRIYQFLLLTTVAYYGSYFLRTTKLFGNTASRVLVALGPQLELGLPYRELYEVLPPGYLLFISSWVKLFGMSIVSFFSIHILLIFLSGYFLAIICKHLFRDQFLQLVVFTSCTIVANAWFIQTDLFSIDFFASTLVLGGLATLLELRNETKKIAIAATLFFWASQFKDIYILSVVCLGPFYLKPLLKKDWRRFLRMIIASAVGPVVTLLVLLGYLQYHGIMTDYMQVMADKYAFRKNSHWRLVLLTFKHVAHIPDQFYLNFPNVMGVLTFVSVSITALTTKNVPHPNFKLLRNIILAYADTYGGKVLLTLACTFSVLYGTIIYGLFAGVQLISIVTLLFLMIGLLLIRPVAYVRSFELTKHAVEPLLMVLLIGIPIFSILSVPFIPVLRNHTYELEEVIQQRVGTDECIMHVYGWEVAASYLYSKRKPCTRHFLVNEAFIVLNIDVSERIRSDLISNPPAAFIYSEGGADIDVNRFEREVVNVRGALAECYQADPNYTKYTKHFFAPITLYWPSDDMTHQELQECWRVHGAPK